MSRVAFSRGGFAARCFATFVDAGGFVVRHRSRDDVVECLILFAGVQRDGGAEAEDAEEPIHIDIARAEALDCCRWLGQSAVRCSAVKWLCCPQHRVSRCDAFEEARGAEHCIVSTGLSARRKATRPFTIMTPGCHGAHEEESSLLQDDMGQKDRQDRSCLRERRSFRS